MIALDAGLKAAAALVAGVLGIVVFAGAPRRAQNRFLAVFLLLIAGNQAAEAVRAALDVGAAARLPWFRIATVFASLDPLFLYYFASLFPERNELNASWKVALVAIPSAAFAFASAWLLPHQALAPASLWVYQAWALFTAVVYSAVLLHFARILLKPSWDESIRPLFLALCIAVLPTWPRVLDIGLFFLGGVAAPGAGGSASTPGVWTLLWYAPPVLAVGAAWAAPRWWRPAPERSRKALLQGAAAGALLTGVLYSWRLQDLAETVGWLQAGSFPTLDLILVKFLDAGGASLRWIAFALLASIAVLRYHVLGATLRGRRRAAQALVALVIVVVGVLLLQVVEVLIGGPLPYLGRGELLVLGVALLASHAFRQGVDLVAERAYGVPDPRDASGRVEAYRLAVEQAVRSGRSVDDPDLARLREELRVDPASADAVARLASSVLAGPLRPDAVLGGRYRILRRLEGGASARVFLARDALLKRDVVIKEVSHGGVDAERVLAEARIAGSLQHPNVVTVFDAVPREDDVLIVSEHVTGGSLAERLRVQGPLGHAEVLGILRGVLAGLQAVHDKGVLHRDLKPANVLLTQEGWAKLADFGIAHVRQDQTRGLDHLRANPGTPRYMAPELFQGAPASVATDVHAVGIMIRECVRAPLPDVLERLATRATAADPAARWASASAMLDALDEAASSLTRGT